MARTKLNAYLGDEGLMARLQARAEETKRSVSYLVRKALAAYLREEKT